MWNLGGNFNDEEDISMALKCLPADFLSQAKEITIQWGKNWIAPGPGDQN